MVLYEISHIFYEILEWCIYFVGKMNKIHSQTDCWRSHKEPTENHHTTSITNERMLENSHAEFVIHINSNWKVTRFELLMKFRMRIINEWCVIWWYVVIKHNQSSQQQKKKSMRTNRQLLIHTRIACNKMIIHSSEIITEFNSRALSFIKQINSVT